VDSRRVLSPRVLNGWIYRGHSSLPRGGASSPHEPSPTRSPPRAHVPSPPRRPPRPRALARGAAPSTSTHAPRVLSQSPTLSHALPRSPAISRVPCMHSTPFLMRAYASRSPLCLRSWAYPSAPPSTAHASRNSTVTPSRHLARHPPLSNRRNCLLSSGSVPPPPRPPVPPRPPLQPPPRPHRPVAQCAVAAAAVRENPLGVPRGSSVPRKCSRCKKSGATPTGGGGSCPCPTSPCPTSPAHP
jgi:hypothetical protein